jgi:large subunit ribosomal protein L5
MSDAVAGKEAGKPAGKQKADKRPEKQAQGGKHAQGGKQAEAKQTEAKQAEAHGHRAADQRSAPPRLQSFYREQVIPKLRSELKIDNVMQVPRIAKITINMGVGEAVADKKIMDAAVADLTKITGQKPLVTKSRKAIASFKIRAGLAVGAKVTLRGMRMYEFLDRLISIAMPRIRDFRGVSPRSFDGQGNYSLGVKEQIIFPEIQYDQIDQVRGMDITITTTAKDDRHGRALLEAFNFPFRK